MSTSMTTASRSANARGTEPAPTSRFEVLEAAAEGEDAAEAAEAAEVEGHPAQR